jgi:geranylgeranyl diphosphate synthase type I
MWHELRLELNVGQYLDMLGSACHERRREVADRICRYKSGKYTVERPLHIGALLAGPSDAAATVEALSRIGLPLGDAFQMRDDVLGVFGDSTVTGKPVGNDLREGKPTPLLARAFDMANASQKEILSTVGQPDLSVDDVSHIQAVIVECGALAGMETLIDELRDVAIAAIKTLIPAGEARDALTSLAVYVTERAA